MFFYVKFSIYHITIYDIKIQIQTCITGVREITSTFKDVLDIYNQSKTKSNRKPTSLKFQSELKNAIKCVSININVYIYIHIYRPFIGAYVYIYRNKYMCIYTPFIVFCTLTPFKDCLNSMKIVKRLHTFVQIKLKKGVYIYICIYMYMTVWEISDTI